jgi:CBS domain-containing protein
MATRKIGCAIVVDEGHLVGMFTVTDALKALAQLAAG